MFFVAAHTRTFDCFLDNRREIGMCSMDDGGNAVGQALFSLQDEMVPVRWQGEGKREECSETEACRAMVDSIHVFSSRSLADL